MIFKNDFIPYYTTLQTNLILLKFIKNMEKLIVNKIKIIHFKNEKYFINLIINNQIINFLKRF